MNLDFIWNQCVDETNDVCECIEKFTRIVQHKTIQAIFDEIEECDTFEKPKEWVKLKKKYNLK